MERSCDVAVVGAGPAGAMAAWGLASAGVDVAVLDRSAFPRDKVCGDALLPDAMQALEEAGLATAIRREALPVACAVFRSPGARTIEVRGDFLTLRRERLDALLVEGALHAGARFLPGLHATAPIEEGGDVRGVFCQREDGGTERLGCRAIVLCCGSNPKLLATFGVLTRPLHSAIAIRTYVPSDPFPRTAAERASPPSLLISYERALLPGYGWSFPLPGGTWNVGCGVFLRGRSSSLPRRGASPTDLRALLARFLASGRGGDPSLTVAVRGATLRTGFTGALPVRGRIAVAGEALGLTLPLTGDGIGKAMQSGLLAGRSLAAALARSADAPDLSSYAERLEARTRSTYRAYAAAQRWMRLPAVSDLIVRRAARSEALGRLLEEIVAERTDPRALLSPLGLLRTVFL